MKIKLAIIGMLSLCVYNATRSATIRIENHTQEQVWAQLNEQKRDQALEEKAKRGVKRTDPFGIFPNLEKIEPKKKHEQRKITILNSYKKPVKKITFFKLVDYQKQDIPWEELEGTINSFVHQYGNMDITFVKDKVIIHDGFSGKTEEYRKNPKKKDAKIEIKLPVFETKEVALIPSIDAGRSGIPIKYEGLDSITLMPKN